MGACKIGLILLYGDFYLTQDKTCRDVQIEFSPCLQTAL